jgi:ubiquinone/menaquinone biosynthesis C-methylase UbiE
MWAGPRHGHHRDAVRRYTGDGRATVGDFGRRLDEEVLMAADRQQTETQDGGTYGSAEAAEAWRRAAAMRAQVLGPVTELMLDLAEVGPGSRVLDVAAGTGEQTLLAAHRVGPSGSVMATDVAARLLASATDAAREAGLENVEARVMDARRLDVDPASFDAAICRSALMLLPERDVVLLGIRRALKPGKKFAAIVLSAPERNPRISSALAIGRRYAGLPPQPVEDPGLFALSDPEVLRGTYEQAGFRDVVIRVMAGQRRFPSVALAMQDSRDSLPELSRLMASLSDAERDAAWAEIEEVSRRFDSPDGVVVPQEWLACVGTA